MSVNPNPRTINKKSSKKNTNTAIYNLEFAETITIKNIVLKANIERRLNLKLSNSQKS